MADRSSWLRMSTTLTLLLLAAAGLGFFTPLNWLPLVVVLAAVTGWQYWQLRRLHRWLLSGKRTPPPRSWGYLQPVSAGIYQLQKSGREQRKELARLLRRFRRGVEAMPDAVLLVESSWQISWSNRQAKKLLGRHGVLADGTRLDELLSQPVQLAQLVAAEPGEPVIFVSPSEEDIRLEMRLIPFAGQQLMMVRDVSERLCFERVRREFVANVSHELRTPLTVVQGYLEALEEMPAVTGDPMLHQAWQSMSQQGTRMNQLVNDLLVLSRFEAPQDESRSDQLVDVPAMLNTLCAEARLLSDGAHKITLQAEVGVCMLGSEKQIRSALQNLLTNAVKYTPPGSRITLTWCRQGDGSVAFSIKDNGDGIASKHLPRLTERFYRVDKTRSQAKGGTGLGLAIVKHALQNHDSELMIESKQRRGSKFSFVIPSQRVLLRGAEPAPESAH